MPSRSFRDLIVWQRAIELAINIYSVTKAFPKEETFGMASQLRRASVSIPSNIAEGNDRITGGEFKHFLGMARGSAAEVQTQLISLAASN
jgi:four helix bundle protein